MSKEFLNIDEQIEKGVAEVRDLIEGGTSRSLGEKRFGREVEKINQRFQIAENFIKEGSLNIAKTSYTKIEQTATKFLEKTDNGLERKYFLDVAVRAHEKRSRLVQAQAAKVFKEEKRHLEPILKEVDPEMMDEFEEVETPEEPAIKSRKPMFLNRLKKLLFGD